MSEHTFICKIEEKKCTCDKKVAEKTGEDLRQKTNQSVGVLRGVTR